MATNPQDIQDPQTQTEIPAEKKEENDWHEAVDDDQNEEEEEEEEEVEEKPKEEVIETKTVLEPKKPLLKDKHGEILITKLDEYIEPPKEVKEAKGDIRDANKYNFKALVGDSHVDDDEEDTHADGSKAVSEVTKQAEEEVSGNKKKKKKKPQKKQEADLDDVFKELGIEIKEEVKETKETKPKKEKKPKEDKPQAQQGDKPKETEDKKEGGEEKEKEKKKKKVVKKVVKKSNHMAELKKEMIDRQDAVKKKDKKKGL